MCVCVFAYVCGSGYMSVFLRFCVSMALCFSVVLFSQCLWLSNCMSVTPYGHVLEGLRQDTFFCLFVFVVPCKRVLVQNSIVSSNDGH